MCSYFEGLKLSKNLFTVFFSQAGISVPHPGMEPATSCSRNVESYPVGPRVVLMQIMLTGALSPLASFIHPSSSSCLPLGLFNIPRFSFGFLPTCVPWEGILGLSHFRKTFLTDNQGEINIVTLRDDCNRLWQSYYFITKGSHRTLIPNCLINVDKRGLCASQGETCRVWWPFWVSQCERKLVTPSISY